MSVLIMLQIECLCPVSSVENWIPKVMVLDGEFFGRRLDHEVWALMNGISEWTYKKGSLSIYIQRRQWHPTPVLLPGKSHGWRSLVGCSPWGREELDVTEQLRFHFSLSCIGEGNGNPFQCSCLENPKDRGAWWAAVSGVAQSRTQLKRLSSSSSSKITCAGDQNTYISNMEILWLVLIKQ